MTCEELVELVTEYLAGADAVEPSTIDPLLEAFRDWHRSSA